MSKIKEHLEALAGITTGRQKGFYVWLLEKGELFTTKDFLIDESEQISKEIDAQRKECFRNSHEVTYLKGLDYYEGFYYFEDIGLVTEHGWNVSEGKVIDVTSVLLKGRPIEWYGVKVDVNEIVEYYGEGIVKEYKKQIKS